MDNTVYTHIEFLRNKKFENLTTTVPPHSHFFYEITYVLKGTLSTEMNDEHFECGPNDILLVPPNTIHSHSSENDYEVIYMGFYYNGLYGALNQKIFNKDNTFIFELLKKMLEEYNNTESYYENVCQELQKILIFNILRLQDTGRSSNNDDVLKYAVAYLQDHYYDNIDMQELAKSLGYSYHHFRHIFKESFDMPPQQFLLNQRLQYAIGLLRSTNQSISDIAKNCGFSSTTRFISAFKSIFKISPTQYRNSDTVNLDISVYFEDNEFKYRFNDKVMPLK